MRHCLLSVLAILALAFTQAVAQNKSEKHSLAGAKIFIAPMQGDLYPLSHHRIRMMNEEEAYLCGYTA